MPRIELMSWERARQLASPIRFQVFVREQRVPAEIELDDRAHAAASEDDARERRRLHQHGFVVEEGDR